MIIIELTYKKSLDEANKHLEAHRDFLQIQYEQGKLLTSGPKNPRDGGIMIALTDKATAEALVKMDPFYTQDIAEYSFIEFLPNNYDKRFKSLFDGLSSDQAR